MRTLLKSAPKEDSISVLVSFCIGEPEPLELFSVVSILGEAVCEGASDFFCNFSSCSHPAHLRCTFSSSSCLALLSKIGFVSNLSADFKFMSSFFCNFSSCSQLSHLNCKKDEELFCEVSKVLSAERCTTLSAMLSACRS